MYFETVMIPRMAPLSSSFRYLRLAKMLVWVSMIRRSPNPVKTNGLNVFLCVDDDDSVEFDLQKKIHQRFTIQTEMKRRRGREQILNTECVPCEAAMYLDVLRPVLRIESMIQLGAYPSKDMPYLYRKRILTSTSEGCDQWMVLIVREIQELVVPIAPPVGFQPCCELIRIGWILDMIDQGLCESSTVSTVVVEG